MGDVADILGMGTGPAPTENEKLLKAATADKLPAKPKGKGVRRPKGMSREVYSLFGRSHTRGDRFLVSKGHHEIMGSCAAAGKGELPPTTTTKKAVVFKDKREVLAGTKYVFRSFENSARSVLHAST
jgi:hypothetical protein